MNQITVVDAEDSSQRDNGTLTAVIKRIGSDDRVEHYLLSCLHVFGIISKGHSGYSRHSHIYAGNTHIGCFSNLAGSFYSVNQKKWSFDAALALIDEQHLQLAAQWIPGPTPKSYCNYVDDTPKFARIHTSDGPIDALDLQVKWGNQQKVYYPDQQHGTVAVHRVVVQYQAQTKPGYSGSPVLSADGSEFLGMHIAGKDGIGYMLPAVDLLDNAGAFIEGLGNDKLILAAESE